MVDLNISILKDAAEAIDKLVDAVRNLAGLIGDSAEKGADLIERKKLRGIHSHTTTFLDLPNIDVPIELVV